MIDEHIGRQRLKLEGVPITYIVKLLRWSHEGDIDEGLELPLCLFTVDCAWNIYFFFHWHPGCIED